MSHLSERTKTAEVFLPSVWFLPSNLSRDFSHKALSYSLILSQGKPAHTPDDFCRSAPPGERRGGGRTGSARFNPCGESSRRLRASVLPGDRTDLVPNPGPGRLPGRPWDEHSELPTPPTHTHTHTRQGLPGMGKVAQPQTSCHSDTSVHPLPGQNSCKTSCAEIS